MKKYLLGLFAIVVAVASVAFTSSPRFATANFRFTGDVLLETEVEDVTEWIEVSGTVNCDNIDHEACRINTVDEAYWQVIGGAKKLNTTTSGGELQMTIVALEYATDHTFYVQTPASGAKVNKN